MTGVESPGGSDAEAPTQTPTPKPQGTLDEPHRLRHSSAAALVGLCIGVVLLVVSGCLIADRSTDPAASKTAFRTSTPPSITTPATTAPATTSVVTPVGGGAAFGRVATNDGKTLVVANLATGSNTYVHTNARTRVYVMLATRAADIRVGATVAVFGQKQSDHSIVAGVITGFSIGAPAK
ncbi:hypothetical protein AB0C34_22205 [Nocardia sp. NPDC049220]|uniref:hypothetical protein n=1 Tax=Nocardia sp. NPDC049220 TaxID=3155273 RepID=UPI0033FB4166